VSVSVSGTCFVVRCFNVQLRYNFRTWRVKLPIQDLHFIFTVLTCTLPLTAKGDKVYSYVALQLLTIMVKTDFQHYASSWIIPYNIRFGIYNDFS
jgi:hypothetical protein